MTPSLKTEFNKLEQQQNALFQKVKPLSHAQQNFKPDANSWSMLQVFRHLMQSVSDINKNKNLKMLDIRSFLFCTCNRI